MSATIQKLVRSGFTPQQAAVLEELYPEVTRASGIDSDSSYLLMERPVGVLSSSAAAVSCSSSASDEILASYTLAAGDILENSILQIEPLWTFTNSANNKILKVKVGNVTVYSATRTTSVKEAPLIVLANRGSLGSQIQPYESTYLTAPASAPSTYNIDFSSSVAIDITGQRASSGDTLKLEYFRILHFVGD